MTSARTIRKPGLLIVDDEPANLQKLRRTFFEDFEIAEARSGEEALRLLRQRAFEAIITDQRMPGLSGVELLRESLGSNPNAIRVILTGYTEVDDLMGAINDGQVHRYITKPWDPFSLRRTVLQDLDHARLKRENHALTEQLRIAAEVQSQLFPKTNPEVLGLEYLGVCRLARSVGGDYYDFLQFQPEKLWIAVGDICGKGISAALLMANLQALVRSQAPIHGEDLVSLVDSLNLQLLDASDGSKFATLFYGLFDRDSRVLRYVNAGHCPPVVVSDAGWRTLGATGTVVGAFPGVRFGQAEANLADGDLLAIYTDGVTEAESSEFEQFGEDRLLELLCRNRFLPLKDLAELILKAVSAHTGESAQQDDQALVLARVKNCVGA